MWPVLALVAGVAVGTATEPALGEAVYRRACAPCHGLEGNGESRAAAWLMPAPRDFTRGVYKFRTTMSGSNPTDEDLARTIREGVPGTSMPAWQGRLSASELQGVIAYLKSMSDWFDTPLEPDEVIVDPDLIRDPPPPTPASVAAGAEVYERMQCAKCHGEDGRGNDENELTDDLGRPIDAFDFTTGRYRGGGRPQDIYRSFTTGLDGTPMPSYDASLTEDERWQLVHYVDSLRRKGPFIWLFQGPSWNHAPGGRKR